MSKTRYPDQAIHSGRDGDYFHEILESADHLRPRCYTVADDWKVKDIKILLTYKDPCPRCFGEE